MPPTASFSLTKHRFQLIAQVIERTIPVINRHLPMGKNPQTGLWLTADNEFSGTHLETCVDIYTGKGESAACLRQAKEQRSRLLCRPSHLTSRRSRNPEAQEFTGAVRLDLWIISGAGLLEECNEAAILFALKHVARLEDDRLTAILNDTQDAQADLVRQWLARFDEEIPDPLANLQLDPSRASLTA